MSINFYYYMQQNMIYFRLKKEFKSYVEFKVHMYMTVDLIFCIEFLLLCSSILSIEIF